MKRYQKEAIKLAGEILADMAKDECLATDREKRANVCFLPRWKASKELCQSCPSWGRFSGS